MNYILASKSPRRKELMEKISSNFLVEVETIDETKYITDNPNKTVLSIAFHKGENIAKRHEDDIVISADTIVVLDGVIYGKPKNEDDAYRILNELSGKTHEVITGYSIFYQNKVVTDTVTTSVEFNELNTDIITSYIKSKSPLDKAGAYGIQDNEKFPIIKNINGSYENVVGFPTQEIIDAIRRLIK